MFDAAQRAAQICAQICEDSGCPEAAQRIRLAFHLDKAPTCALLTPKDKNEDRSN